MGDKFSAGRAAAGLASGDQRCSTLLKLIVVCGGVIIYGDYNDRTQWRLRQCHILYSAAAQINAFNCFDLSKGRALCQVHFIAFVQV